MTLIAQPAHVPLGFVKIGNTQFPVYINPPWQKMLQAVPAAIGTASITSTPPPVFMDMSDSGTDEPLMIPGPTGPPTPPQTVLMLLVEEYVSDEPIYIPR